MPTPMIRQYNQLKEKHKDCILFFRLGDFYEMFGDDAVTASNILNITLTKRNKGENTTLMCGVPYHSVDGYLYKLTNKGYKVAICEQISEPTGKGIVMRDVVRIVTPGTTLDDKSLDNKTNNYICYINPEKEIFGISYLDVTTGEFVLDELYGLSNVVNELVKLNPKEIIIPDNYFKCSNLYDLLSTHLSGFVYPYSSINTPIDTLLNHFKVSSLESFGVEKYKAGLAASGSLLCYVLNMQKTELPHIKKIVKVAHNTYMHLDEGTIKNLEIFYSLNAGEKKGSLLSVIDNTKTAMGGRMLKKWVLAPLVDAKKIQIRQEAVAEIIEKNEDYTDEFKSIADLERLLSRITIGIASARELVSLRESHKALAAIKERIDGLDSPMFVSLNKMIDPLSNLTNHLDQALVPEPPVTVRDGGMFQAGYRPELDELLNFKKQGSQYLEDLKAREIERTGITNLKIGYNRVFGYYLEITNKFLDKIPEDYIKRQTLTNCERCITPELKEYEEKILSIDEKLKTMEYNLFQELVTEVKSYTEAIQNNAKAIAMLDIINCFAINANSQRWVKPTLTKKKELKIIKGRHPIVEKFNQDRPFIPNDLYLNKDKEYLIILTGPNMAGKSTYLRQSAIIILLAQIGSYVPAEAAEIPLCDRIFTRIGTSDNLIKGQSTFMVEMQETANILHNATENSFVILDEVGRGTSTFDGVSIAWALVEDLHNNVKAMTIFATHYHELISLVDDLKHSANFSISASEQENELVFHYNVKRGAVNRSFGIQVAQMAGIKMSIINRAKEILSDFEHSSHISISSEAGVKPQAPSGLSSTTYHPQLGLFESDASKVDKIKEKLKNLDINNLTPLAALTLLDEIKKEI